MSNVKTGGKKRGIIARWIFRFEASSQIFRIIFLGITAASTLTTALVATGHPELAPWVLGSGTAGSPIFAYVYTKHILNRKNRERAEMADNFSGPGMYMGNLIRADSEAAALQALENGEDPREAAREAVRENWAEFRDGIDVEELDARY